MKPVDRPTQGSTCNHQFIISKWQFNQSMQFASNFICQYCLLTVTGPEDERLKDKSKGNRSQDSGEENGKSTNRKEQKADTKTG
jgi:hypothetical protein